jgi:hypothetical protein
MKLYIKFLTKRSNSSWINKSFCTWAAIEKMMVSFSNVDVDSNIGSVLLKLEFFIYCIESLCQENERLGSI